MLDDREFLSQLKRLQLCLKPALRVKTTGMHPLPHRGRSLEFAVYREYRPGDDSKELDWKIFARSDRYYIKQRDHQSPATVLILLDNSASMDWQSSQAGESKLFGALLLIFGLGYILHQQGDAFSLYAMYPPADPLPPRSSRKSLNRLVHQLRQIQKAGGQVNPTAFNLEWNHPAVDHLLVISDFMVPEPVWRNWLRPMRAMAGNISFFRVLDQAEINPDAQQFYLQSLEDPQQKRQVTPKNWEDYRVEFERHSRNLLHACRRHGIMTHQVITQTPIHAAIQKILSQTCFYFSG